MSATLGAQSTAWPRHLPMPGWSGWLPSEQPLSKPQDLKPAHLWKVRPVRPLVSASLNKKSIASSACNSSTSTHNGPFGVRRSGFQARELDLFLQAMKSSMLCIRQSIFLPAILHYRVRADRCGSGQSQACTGSVNCVDFCRLSMCHAYPWLAHPQKHTRRPSGSFLAASSIDKSM